MANVKQGNATRPPQWWKHLRKWKRIFWKKERREHSRRTQELQREWEKFNGGWDER